MPIKDLVTDPGTGQLSHTKLWANVAYATATLIVIIMAVNGTLGGEIFLCYLAGVGMSAAASKFASLKLGGFEPTPTASPWSPDHGSSVTYNSVIPNGRMPDPGSGPGAGSGGQ